MAKSIKIKFPVLLWCVSPGRAVNNFKKRVGGNSYNPLYYFFAIIWKGEGADTGLPPSHSLESVTETYETNNNAPWCKRGGDIHDEGIYEAVSKNADF